MAAANLTRRGAFNLVLVSAAITSNDVRAQPTPFGFFAGSAQFLGGPPIPVFRYPGFPGGGQARPGFNGEPIIIVDAGIAEPFLSFVVAHEYAHHVLGHITQLIANQMMNGPLGACFLTPRIELEADAWATQTMKMLRNLPAVQSAVIVNNWQGFFAAPCYPPGAVRARNIEAVWMNS